MTFCSVTKQTGIVDKPHASPSYAENKVRLYLGREDLLRLLSRRLIALPDTNFKRGENLKTSPLLPLIPRPRCHRTRFLTPNSPS
ncbi:hypothetical protein E2C01_072051 [Portunus trituberculatus]|uniref:Uncharacterized protein n=1 Tax=Portunus trituberculatus TaxID=210409 RepID=A0A5B7IA31_PORTR|nr:hypothetical protein [Portunus trituberculatus]